MSRGCGALRTYLGTCTYLSLLCHLPLSPHHTVASQFHLRHQHQPHLSQYLQMLTINSDENGDQRSHLPCPSLITCLGTYTLETPACHSCGRVGVTTETCHVLDNDFPNVAAASLFLSTEGPPTMYVSGDAALHYLWPQRTYC